MGRAIRNLHNFKELKTKNQMVIIKRGLNGYQIEC